MKQKNSSSISIYLEIGVLLVAIFILVAPVFAVINHRYSSEQTTTTDQSSPKTQDTDKQSSPSTSKPKQDETPKDTDATSPPVSPEPTTPTPSNAPEPTPSNPTPVTSTCHHEEQGVCWDDIEDATYSAGLYDREYGYYGASVDYPNSCNSVCRDIIDDAYEEGWYDGGY